MRLLILNRNNFFAGVWNGLIMSMPLWAAILLLIYLLIHR